MLNSINTKEIASAVATVHRICLHLKSAATRENPSSGFLTRYDINRPVQSQKQAISLKVLISEEKLYYPCIENKEALICAFVLAYASCLVYLQYVLEIDFGLSSVCILCFITTMNS